MYNPETSLHSLCFGEGVDHTVWWGEKLTSAFKSQHSQLPNRKSLMLVNEILWKSSFVQIWFQWKLNTWWELLLNLCIFLNWYTLFLMVRMIWKAAIQLLNLIKSSGDADFWTLNWTLWSCIQSVDPKWKPQVGLANNCWKDTVGKIHAKQGGTSCG